MKMSTPRPRATPDLQEDVHTQAKSHTGLSRRRPHSGEEPHFISPADADTGHGPHRSGDDQKKKKKTSWLCWFLFRAVAVVSRLVFCVAPVLSPFCGVRGPACVASWLSVVLPFSFRAPTQELAFPVLFRYPLPVCLTPLVCSIDVAYIFIGSFSLSSCSHDLLSRCSPHSSGALLRYPSPRSHLWDFRQQGADMDGLVAELFCKLRRQDVVAHYVSRNAFSSGQEPHDRRMILHPHDFRMFRHPHIYRYPGIHRSQGPHSRRMTHHPHDFRMFCHPRSVRVFSPCARAKGRTARVQQLSVLHRTRNSCCEYRSLLG